MPLDIPTTPSIPTTGTPVYDQLQTFYDLDRLFEADCKCESAHNGTASLVCDIIATCRIRVACGKKSALICESLAVANLVYMEEENHVCLFCEQPAKSCWTITSL